MDPTKGRRTQPAEPTQSQAAADDEARRTRLASSIAILLVALYFVMAIGVGALEWSIQGGPSWAPLAPITLSAYVLVGALVVIRRGSHPIGWILQAIGITALITATSEDYVGYALVVHLGGAVEIDSAPGAGTRIRGRLPLMAGSLAP